jgi:hypothetical protein
LVKEVINVDIEKYMDRLQNLEEEEILSVIVMTLGFYINKYDRNLERTISLIKKGYKEYGKILKEMEEGELKCN